MYGSVFNLSNKAGEHEILNTCFFLNLLGGFGHQFRASFDQPEIVFLCD